MQILNTIANISKLASDAIVIPIINTIPEHTQAQNKTNLVFHIVLLPPDRD